MDSPLSKVYAAAPAQGRARVVQASAPTSPDSTDACLVRRAQHGDRKAYDLLVMRYQHRILALASRYTHNRADAEDVAQETFIKAYRALKRFRGECAFYTWLHRIGLNSARDFLNTRRRDTTDRLREYRDAVAADEVSSHAQDVATPEELLCAEHIQNVIDQTLEALPEGHRRVIMLREIDGLRYEQIAAALSIPVGTVRSRVFRAREVIDEKLRAVVEGGLGRHTSHAA